MAVAVCFLFLAVIPLRATLRNMPEFSPEPAQLARLARTSAIIANANPTNRGTLRVLFYGQSITLQPWWEIVASTLRTTCTNVDFTIENRAISGFQADLLAQTVKADVIDVQPDLVILHCYGFEDETDRLLRMIHDGCTAEVLVQRDHPTVTGQAFEPTDPAQVPSSDWWAYRNYVWLPRLCDTYGDCLADVRGIWKLYMKANSLTEGDLLRDATHPNSEGNELMAAAVLKYLLAPPVDPYFDADQNRRVRKVSLNPSSQWASQTLEAEFNGNRIDLVTTGGDGATLNVFIDDKPPSSHPELIVFTRPSNCQGQAWPANSEVIQRTNLVAEDWTLTLLEIGDRAETFRYRVDGTVTGFDGEGWNRTNFLSNSGRVFLAWDNWWIPLAVKITGIVPKIGFRVTWQARLQGVDRVEQGANPPPGSLRTITLATGLADGPHRLRIERTRPGPGGIVSLRAHSPSGHAQVSLGSTLLPWSVDRLVAVAGPNGPLLVWPVDWTGVHLESTATDRPIPQWRAVTAPVQKVGEVRVVAPGSTGGSQLFRLVPP